MSGDKIDLSVQSYYNGTGTPNAPNNSFTNVLNSLVNGIVSMSSGGKGTVTQLTGTGSPVYTGLTSFLAANDPVTTGKPKAYLNWILLDDQLKYVSSYPQSGAIAAGSSATLKTLAYTGIPITKNGFLYIWVSNETPSWDAFFDNLKVTQYTGPELEETHYYPFGLTMAAISSKALKPKYIQNNYKYNSKEIQNQEFSDGTGLEDYDYNARMSDPQLGIWHNIDALADLAPNFSPYTFCYDNPLRYIDPTGMDGEDGNDNKNPQRVKYLYNKSTGEVTTQNVSEDEYQTNTKGGTTNLVQGDPSGGGHLRFDYSRSDGGTGAYSVNTYLGTNSDDVGLRDDKYHYDGAHYEGGNGSGENNNKGSNSLDIAGKIVDGGVGGIGVGTGTLTAEFLWSTSMNAQIDGSLLSNSTVNLLGKFEGLSAFGEGVAKAAPFIGLGIAALKMREAYNKEGHFGRQTARTGVIAVAGVAGGYGGAEGGAAIGATIGVWFGGVGAVPGAIIGGVIGGFVGSWGGEKIAEGVTQ